MTNKWIYLSMMLFLILSCTKDDVKEEIPTVEIHKVSVNGSSFIDAEGFEVLPWGFNYTNAENGVGLIEDNWNDESVWQTIQEDFIEMRDLGANIVRIHLQYHRFMIDATTPNQSALDKLEELVKFAESEGLYLDITGLAAYRKMDQPSFYSEMNDEERWDAQAIFWQNIAKTLKGNDAVFAFNLMNEPVVSVGCDIPSTCDWLPGDGFGGYHFVQNITLTEGNDYEETLRAWVNRMTEAIRIEDSKTLITFGSLALGPYNRFEDDLDYLSPHIYPKSGEIENAINHVINNASSVPVIIEETANLHCNIEELKEFVEAIDGHYNGLMGHYSGIPYDELDDSNIGHALQKNFLDFFTSHNPN